MFGRVLFESKLSGKCLGSRVVELEVDKVETAVVVCKDSGALVAFLCKFAF